MSPNQRYPSFASDRFAAGMITHRPRTAHCFRRCLLAVLLLTLQTATSAKAQSLTPDAPPRDPVAATLIPMDLTGAQAVLRKHDLNDDRSLSQTEWARLGWEKEEIRRFDLNRNGSLQHLEIALKLADGRLDDGIVQMDSILAERYTNQYDADRDGVLTLRELANNSFTDQLDVYDKNSDDQLTSSELIRGLAWERQFRAELGIKGCDQGGAMKLINRGDQNGDRRIDGDELDAAGLSTDALKFDRNGDKRLSVSELAEQLAHRRNRMGLTPSDQLAARGILRRADRDGDGVISVNELPPTQGGSGLAEADQNGDGSVSELELEQFFGERRKKLGYNDEHHDRATTLIGRNDSDRSRSLSRSELVASGSGRSGPLSPDKLPVIDENGDGAINVDELARYLKKTE